ncbi:BamA/TamA family outer membrane protein [Flavihumibacter profundi]|uniref:BamA/TamA family outer membrane protein n=1 Tax=Flavihumibacter profundi TaxID=2716883 RepID=UPI001CC71EC9|nr:BamA/TamA family outer membrane protein [Flavihumibacter profundi]MBZ5858146.1 outer membrane protein assembly factor [Flavihumibacter profundi]
MKKIFFLFCFLFSLFLNGFTQDSTKAPKDSLSKFDSFNQKMEHLFKIIPVPIFSYSPEAGQIFGLAKFNLFTLNKKDTISNPTRLSEVFTFSTEGRINASVSTEMSFKENKYVVLSAVNYRVQPEYIFGIGNEINPDSLEQVQYSRFRFMLTGLRLIAKNLYAGPVFDLSNYFDIKPDSNSFLIRDNVTGLNGGFNFGVGIAVAYDSRDNRYNTTKGTYIISSLMGHPAALGSVYPFTKWDLDARKFFNPWLKHVIALQATTTYISGDAPFYDLAMLGGENKMRGYYLGALRDKVLVDAQVEYRLPVWNIFGLTGWLGTGRVANTYSGLNIDGFYLSYGVGLRIRVDTKHNTNMRFDFGFGPNNVQGVYINFAEAF